MDIQKSMKSYQIFVQSLKPLRQLQMTSDGENLHVATLPALVEALELDVYAPEHNLPDEVLVVHPDDMVLGEHLEIQHEEVVVDEDLNAQAVDEDSVVQNEDIVVAEKHYSEVVVDISDTQQNSDARSVPLPEEDSDRVLDPDTVPDLDPLQEEVLVPGPVPLAAQDIGFHRVESVYQSWLSNISHALSLFQGKKYFS